MQNMTFFSFSVNSMHSRESATFGKYHVASSCQSKYAGQYMGGAIVAAVGLAENSSGRSKSEPCFINLCFFHRMTLEYN